MIARTWHGKVPREKAEEYRRYVLETGVPGYRSAPGNRGVLLLRRDEGDVTHFLLFSLWDSFEGIRAFAGTDVERARYFPEDEAYLLELEATVTHYEIVDVVGLDVE